MYTMQRSTRALDPRADRTADIAEQLINTEKLKAAVQAIGRATTWSEAAERFARGIRRALDPSDVDGEIQHAAQEVSPSAVLSNCRDRSSSVACSEHEFELDELDDDLEALEQLEAAAESAERDGLGAALDSFFAASCTREFRSLISFLPHGVSDLVVGFLREKLDLPAADGDASLDWLLRVLLPQIEPSPAFAALLAGLPAAAASEDALAALRAAVDAAFSRGAADGDVLRLLCGFAVAASPLRLVPRFVREAAAGDERVCLRLLEYAHRGAVEEVAFANPRALAPDAASAALEQLVAAMAGHERIGAVRVQRAASVRLEPLLRAPARLATLELDFVPGPEALPFFARGGLERLRWLSSLRLHALDVADEHLAALRGLRGLRRLGVTCCPRLVSEPFASLPFLQRLEGLEVKELQGGGESVEKLLCVRETLRELHLGELLHTASARRRARLLRGQPATFPRLESISLHHCEANFERIVFGGEGEGPRGQPFPALRRVVMESGTWDLRPFAGCPRLETVLFTDGVMARRPEWIHRLLESARTMPALKEIRIGAPCNPAWGPASQKSPLAPKIHIHGAGEEQAAEAAVSAAASVPTPFLTHLRM